MILYRPVGLTELKLIAETDFTTFPPRLPEQPIFYPVLELQYAEQIARDWNARYNDDRAGFVTRFEVESVYARNFEVQKVGAKWHKELWVPAEQLAEFNRHIVGKIEVVAAYYGEGFDGALDPETNLPSGIVDPISRA